MLRRLKLFGVGFLIGIVIIFSNKKLKDNFLDYVGYGDSNERIVEKLKYELEVYSHDILYADDTVRHKLAEYSLDSVYLLKVLDGGWENRKESRELKEGFKLFVIDNNVNGEEISVYFNFNEKEHTVIIDDFYLNEGISKKSFFSYFAIFLIFLIIMVPTSLLVRKLIRKRRFQDE
jgi:hypothetical protein